MNKTTMILIFVGVGVLLLIVGIIAFISFSNHRKSKKLQANLDKYKEENKVEEEPSPITLAPDIGGENVSAEEIFSSDFDNSQDSGFFKQGKKEEDVDLDERSIFEEFENNDKESMPRMPRQKSYKQTMRERQERDAEFQEFLDEHAFSRKVFDKPLLDKIKKLPPEIKSIIMGNIFNKFDDDK